MRFLTDSRKGGLGSAILLGILSSLQDLKSPATGSQDDDLPPKLPNKFIACVKRPESVKRLESELEGYPAQVLVFQNDNITAVKQSDIVLLGCKPYMLKDVLGQEGMKEALDGKILISILAGVTVSQIQKTMYEDSTAKCTIVRAMPNTAALVRQSMTVLEISTPPLADETTKLLTWIFKQIGEVAYLPAATMDASTALCGSGPAFFALMMEAAIDGALAMGLPRIEARKMAAQTMKGAASLVLSGENPALLREKVCTPGGCTIGGLLVLEEGGVRGTVSRAIREATDVASQLGKGVQGVNGTRFSR